MYRCTPLTPYGSTPGAGSPCPFFLLINRSKAASETPPVRRRSSPADKAASETSPPRLISIRRAASHHRGYLKSPSPPRVQTATGPGCHLCNEADGAPLPSQPRLQSPPTSCQAGLALSRPRLLPARPLRHAVGCSSSYFDPPPPTPNRRRVTAERLAESPPSRRCVVSTIARVSPHLELPRAGPDVEPVWP